MLTAITSNFSFIVASISRCDRLRSTSAEQYGQPSWVNIRMTRLPWVRASSMSSFRCRKLFLNQAGYSVVLAP